MVKIAYPNIILDSLEMGVIILDGHFNIFYWNKWLEISTGIQASEILEHNLKEFYTDINYDILSRKIRTALRLNSPTFYDASLDNHFIKIPRTKITTSSLKTKQLQVTISPYIPSENLVIIAIQEISDLYELKLALEEEISTVAKLNLQLQRDKSIIDHNLLIIKLDENLTLVETSHAFLEFFQISNENSIGLSMEELLLIEEPVDIHELIMQNNQWRGEIKIVLNDVIFWFDTVITPPDSHDNDYKIFTLIFHDISDKKRIEDLSVTDPLTKLFNRHKFNDIFENMLKRKHWDKTSSFGLLIIDIDHFKQFNDQYGHQVGDKVLTSVADTLTHMVRTGDIVSRWGGEEFVCLLPNVDLPNALLVAEKLRNSIENLQILNIKQVTVSIGVSVYMQGDDLESLFHRADTALYTAKTMGRNRIQY